MTVPAAVLDVVGTAPVQAVLADAVAERLGLPVRTTALVLDGPLDGPTRERIESAVALRAPEAFVSRPGGSSSDDRGARIALLLPRYLDVRGCCSPSCSSGSRCWRRWSPRARRLLLVRRALLVAVRREQRREREPQPEERSAS